MYPNMLDVDSERFFKNNADHLSSKYYMRPKMLVGFSEIILLTHIRGE